MARNFKEMIDRVKNGEAPAAVLEMSFYAPPTDSEKFLSAEKSKAFMKWLATSGPVERKVAQAKYTELTKAGSGPAEQYMKDLRWLDMAGFTNSTEDEFALSSKGIERAKKYGAHPSTEAASAARKVDTFLRENPLEKKDAPERGAGTRSSGGEVLGGKFDSKGASLQKVKSEFRTELSSSEYAKKIEDYKIDGSKEGATVSLCFSAKAILGHALKTVTININGKDITGAQISSQEKSKISKHIADALKKSGMSVTNVNVSNASGVDDVPVTITMGIVKVDPPHALTHLSYGIDPATGQIVYFDPTRPGGAYVLGKGGSAEWKKDVKHIPIDLRKIYPEHVVRKIEALVERIRK